MLYVILLIPYPKQFNKKREYVALFLALNTHSIKPSVGHSN